MYLIQTHFSHFQVTIFKNITNLATVAGDWYFFGENINFLTVIAVLVMTFGAAMAGANDLEFNYLGYFWMLVNCACTAGITHLYLFSLLDGYLI